MMYVTKPVVFSAIKKRSVVPKKKTKKLPKPIPKPKPMKARPKVAKKDIPRQGAAKQGATKSSVKWREMSPQELALWRDVEKRRLEAISNLNSALNRGRICRDLQGELDKYGILDVEIWNKKDTADAENMARVGNSMERLFSNLESKKFFLDRKGNDFVVTAEKNDEQFNGVGNPVVFVAGAVIIVGLIAWITRMVTETMNKNIEYGDRLLAADKWVSTQSPKVQAAYKSYRDKPENSSFWPSFSGIGKTVGYVALGLFGVYLLSRMMKHD